MLTMKTIKGNLASALCKVEGKKSQVKRGDMLEVLTKLADLAHAGPEVRQWLDMECQRREASAVRAKARKAKMISKKARKKK